MCIYNTITWMALLQRLCYFWRFLASQNMRTVESLFTCPSSLTWDALQQAKFAFTTPFQLPLKDGIFHSEKVLRILPRKRIIAFGTWNNKPVVAKIFFNHKRAKRHLETEVAGVNGLIKKQVPTPAIYYQDTALADDRIYVLIFERLQTAQPFEDIWKAKETVATILPRIEFMFAQFAEHHAMGVVQRDPNLKNYMLENDMVYMIDAADVDVQDAPLSKKDSIQNLAIFLSQFGSEIATYQAHLFEHYAKARGLTLTPDDMTELRVLTDKHTAGRLERLKRRIFNECRYFSLINKRGVRGVLNRNFAAPHLLNFLYQPKAVTPDTSQYSVKYYPNSILEIVMSIFRKSKAYQEWRATNIAHFEGRYAPKPIAYVEQRKYGFCYASCYVCEA